jgi:hypothetical protein
LLEFINIIRQKPASAGFCLYGTAQSSRLRAQANVLAANNTLPET